MKSLLLISRLLDYPTEELYQSLAEAQGWIADSDELTEFQKSQLASFISYFADMDLLDWQADYDSLFERGRSVSLLLFEHIHGESRDRGQAMINLLNEYKQAGLDIGIKELPDYIPLFLEFLSTQGRENAQGWLQDVAHILALLKVRLEQRDSIYQTLFSVLVELSGAHIDFADLTQQIKGEKRDDSKEAIDKVWEEEMVKFTAENGCETAVNRPSEGQRRDQQVPISFVDAAQNSAQNPSTGVN